MLALAIQYLKITKMCLQLTERYLIKKAFIFLHKFNLNNHKSNHRYKVVLLSAFRYFKLNW